MRVRETGGERENADCEAVGRCVWARLWETVGGWFTAHALTCEPVFENPPLPFLPWASVARRPSEGSPRPPRSAPPALRPTTASPHRPRRPKRVALIQRASERGQTMSGKLHTTRHELGERKERSTTFFGEPGTRGAKRFGLTTTSLRSSPTVVVGAAATGLAKRPIATNTSASSARNHKVRRLISSSLRL